MNWAAVWIGWVVGLVTPFAVVALYSWLQWACRRTTGYDDCMGNCGSPAREIGELPNLAVWWLQLWHRVWWSYRPSHRQAVRDYRRPAPGLWTDAP